MGQNVSVDTEPAGLKELLGLGHSVHPAEPSTLPFDFSSTSHHVKAWRFETRGNCFAEAPVALCDENGRFHGQLHRSSSYLILHVESASTPSVSSSSVLLEEFSTRVGSTCTPRGLAAPCVSRNESGHEPSQLRYSIFVWNGRGTEQLLRAYVESKAYELDSHLCKGLHRHPGFVGSPKRGVTLRGSENIAQSDGGSLYPLQAGHGRNVLVCSLGKTGECKTWCRLSRAIMKGSTARQGVRCDEKGPMFPDPPCLKPGSPPPTSSLSPGTMPSSTSPAAPSRPGRPVVPRLALAPLREQGAAVSRSVPPPTISPSSRSTDSSEGMEIDDPADSSSSRKRHRAGEDAEVSPSRTSQTARAAPSPLNLVAVAATAAMMPQTSREQDFSSPMPSTSQGGQSPLEQVKREVPSLSLARPGFIMPVRSPGAFNGQKQTSASGADVPTMLNLEDINMSEEELMSSYDPDNEENNYHLPDHIRRRLQLNHFRQICSEVLPGVLFISGYQVASDEDALRARKITHIVNTAADICDCCFPDKFQYRTYYLKDANWEEISLLFYKTLEWIHEAISKGGRVLVHCREGVSRSATFIIAYLMWRLNLSFEAAHDHIRQARPICNPNTGFTCQLLQLAKRLGTSGQAVPMTDRAMLFRVAPYHPKEPFLLLTPTEWQGQTTKFDPRFGWVLQVGLQMILWIGSQVPDPSATREAVEEHLRRLELFERCQCSLTVVNEGEEVPLFWQALGELGSAAEPGSLVCAWPALDADYDVLVASAAGSSKGSALEAQDEACA
eukprot:TRINITY_DN42418_c0_g1_i1.p1 TRINITY_DN42418_c0_g1~~TRINITY_DN42418_c0_g1_i1.p1  ORF type:complete len:782 (-),score=95.94 TRINITY_DN42418_c0_g1_i1:111-2456(-)